MPDDISSRKDIEKLVKTFYTAVLDNPEISFFFTEVVPLNFDQHMPKMYDFWDSLLLGSDTYHGNPMVKHLELNRLEAIKPAHFIAWLTLWEETVRSLFEGPKAEEAISRAKHIAQLMQFKVESDPLST